MIRYINCFRKNPDMSDEEFRRFWCSDHYNELVRELVKRSKAARYSKNLTLQVEATQKLIEDRGIGEPYDAVLEYWWDNAGRLMSFYESEEAHKLFQEMSDYQKRFIDLSRSTAFFTEDDKPL